jgi:hypothetical protein
VGFTWAYSEATCYRVSLWNIEVCLT